MEKPSITYSATQSIDYLGQTHKWTDTDIIPSYKEICKQLDVCQKKLREEREQKGQRELRKSTSYSKQLEQQGEESTLRVEEKRLIRMKNALWRRMGSSVCYVGKGSKLESPKTLKR
ncbi:hypothetical protein RclHR1_04150007 [Rhizophagus clarus]|uniref:Uncharacterized protein n=1 Tax=Rhizophagus clarus TaxID=94130 RepID=A0A2Z6RJW0_9GLOM|nr:hypothetical protein RclHR1_04150007 [Rhizophagus clarus]